MNQRRTVAIYARISQDRDGSGLGVARQVRDCRAEAERRGWQVAEEYVDDDVSAYGGAPRPAYSRMLSDLADGQRDAVIVYHLDRLHRRPIELEEFVATCTAAGVSDVVTLHGDFDIGNGDGLLVARLLSAVAANESYSKRRRGRRKMLELAEAGKPHGGGTRSFGFMPDRITHDPGEAQVIRELVARALAGETLTSLARWLAASDVPTVMGKEWRTPTLRNLLTSPRIYGMRTHQGQVIGEAVWEPIISREDGERLRQMLTDPARRTNRSARKYLLSGMCRCARCGSVMFSVPRYETRRYLCRSGHDFGGCGRMAVTAELLELWVRDAVLVALDTPAMTQAITGSAPAGDEVSVLAAAIEADDGKLSDLASMWADGEITRGEWSTARNRIEKRLTANRRTMARLTNTSALQSYLGHGQDLRGRWDDLNLDRQVRIVKAIVDQVVIHPATTPGRKGLDPSRVEIVWRS